MDIWGKNIPRSGYSQCKCPEAGHSVFREQLEGRGWSREREGNVLRDEVREVMGNKSGRVPYKDFDSE